MCGDVGVCCVCQCRCGDVGVCCVCQCRCGDVGVCCVWGCRCVCVVCADVDAVLFLLVRLLSMLYKGAVSQ